MARRLVAQVSSRTQESPKAAGEFVGNDAVDEVQLLHRVVDFLLSPAGGLSSDGVDLDVFQDVMKADPARRMLVFDGLIFIVLSAAGHGLTATDLQQDLEAVGAECSAELSTAAASVIKSRRDDNAVIASVQRRFQAHICGT